MKKWEEERRKKIYKKKLKQTKSIVNTNNRPKSSKTPGMHSKNYMRQSTAGSTRRVTNRASTEYLISPVSDPSASWKMSDLVSEDISLEFDEVPLDQTLIFKLLQGFKLQQYAKKMNEFGFGMEIYKLAILSEKEKDKLIEDLRPLPGHSFKFQDMFTFLNTVYPRENARRDMKKAGTATQYNRGEDNRFLASSNQIHHKTKKKKKSLIKRYERLDPYKRDLINKRFLDNLKIKGGINIATLWNQVVTPMPVIQNIFPPDQFGYEDILNNWALAYSEEASVPSIYNIATNDPIIEEDDEEDKNDTKVTASINEEIDSIIQHYAGNAVDNVSLLKQKDILDAQNRAKQRLKLNKKKDEVTKMVETK